jgi:TetR/AcrR family transcriptional repressor of lmrAB and yxaGH operons
MPGMARHTDARERVLQAAAGLFQQQGYSATGLTQVLTESSAPKGSLYFHFPGGKEQLAAESVALSGNALGERMAAVVAAADGPKSAIAGLGEIFVQGLRESDFHSGCPVATVALEAAAGSELIRAACDGTYTTWLDGLAVALRRWGVGEDTAGPLATLVLSSLQGAILLAKVRRDVGPIHSVADQVGDLIARSITPCTPGTP